VELEHLEEEHLPLLLLAAPLEVPEEVVLHELLEWEEDEEAEDQS
jgi:hypothetical protein